MKLSVFGAGSWGTALAQSLCFAGLDVTLWCRDADQADWINGHRTNPKRLCTTKLHSSLKATGNLAEAADAPLWILATPAQTLRDMLTLLGPHVAPETKALCASKGIEIATQLLPHQVAGQVCPELNFGDISGPSHAEEVIKNLPACLVVACRKEQDALFWQQLLIHSTLRIYTSTDLAGVEVGGAVKNVIAVASGYLHQRKLGDNAAAALVTRGLAEMTRLAVALQAQPETLSGLAGIGDLMVTSFSAHSRNYRLGTLLADGKSLEQAKEALGETAEGAPTAEALHILTDKLGVEMPLCEAVWQVLQGQINGQEALVSLMSRTPRAENESFK